MSKKENGGSAFPCPETENYSPKFGMSLRDYFAAKAMQGFFTSRNTYLDNDVIEAYARQSYVTADAMLKAREE